MKPWEKYQQATTTTAKPWEKYKSSEPKQEGHDFSVGNMVSNIPGSAVQLVKDMAQPILHPIDTVEALGKLGSGLGQKLAASGEEHAVLSNPENVATVDAMGAAMQERYGGWDEIKRTAEQDPVGILSDVAGLMTGGATIAAKAPGKVGALAAKAGTMGKAIDPVNMAINSGKAVAKTVPDHIPAKLYESAAKFGTTLTPEQRSSMTQTALKEQIMPTQKGLDKLNDLVTSEMDQVDAILQTAKAEGKTVHKSKLLSRARQARNRVSKITTPDSAKRIKQVDDVINSFGRQWKDIDVLSPTQAQTLKRELDKVLRWDKKQLQSQIGTSDAQFAVRTAAKDALEEMDPAVAGHNRRAGDLIELRDKGLERSAARIENHNPVSLTQTVGATGGAASAGIPGAVGGAALGWLNGPKAQAHIALTLDALKKTPLKDIYFNSNGTLTELGRQALIQMGRLKETSQSANSEQ